MIFNTASDSTVSEDAGIVPRTVAITALTVKLSNHSARSHPVDEICLKMGLAKPLKTKLENIANAAVSFSKSE
jgi:hypothetical protein